jgi:hypothetical protein
LTVRRRILADVGGFGAVTAFSEAIEGVFLNFSPPGL